MIMKKLRTLLLAGGISLLSAAVPAQAEEAYPDHAIQLINPYAPGGPVDMLSRLLAKQLSEDLKQSIVVINKAGAGAAIGASYVARSKADGYTVLLGTAAAFFITPATTETNYKMDDFTYIGMADNAANMLVVPPSLPVHNLKEFIALVKSQPGKLSYSSSGVGTSPHVGMEDFKQRAGFDMLHVPYKGAAPAIVDLLDGRVQAGLFNLTGVLPLIKSGKLRPIAYASATRSKWLPDVPTFAEAGMPGFTSGSWHALAVPAATPRPVVDRLVKALADAQKSPEFQDGVQQLGSDLFPLGPDETTAYIADEAKRTIEIFKATGTKLQ
jgi:tripartite-type tricarboxylate transporter receptor subunit TctC